MVHIIWASTLTPSTIAASIDLTLTRALPLVQRGHDAQQHQHRAAAEVGHQVQRRHRRPVAVAQRGQRAGLRQVVDVMTGGRGQRPVLPPAGDPREDQPRIDRRAVGGPDAEPLAGAGPETIEQHVGLGGQLQQRPRLRLDVQVDDPLAAVQQVALLGRHRQPAGPAHPHHVGAQVGKHHPRVRSGPDAAELDDPHPGQGTPAAHRPLLTLLPAAPACAVPRSRRPSCP